MDGLSTGRIQNSQLIRCSAAQLGGCILVRGNAEMELMNAILQQLSVILVVCIFEVLLMVTVHFRDLFLSFLRLDGRAVEWLSQVDWWCFKITLLWKPPG